MLDDLAVARVDGRLSRLMASRARVDVLVIDDLALQPLTNEQAAALLEVVEDRSQLRSTIVTSQLRVKHWHEALGEATIGDAILDRLVHNAHRLEQRGESLRRPESAADHHVSDSETGTDPMSDGKSRRRPENRRAETPAEAR